jgi:hypothetical protein
MPAVNTRVFAATPAASPGWGLSMEATRPWDGEVRGQGRAHGACAWGMHIGHGHAACALSGGGGGGAKHAGTRGRGPAWRRAAAARMRAAVLRRGRAQMAA